MRKFLPPVILVLSLGLVYLFTLAPGLTWANDGADGGDLISAAATGGIPHPTGYPLYILLARLFQWLPFGQLAWRTNLLSAVAAVAAACLVYAILTHLPGAPTREDWLPGLAAALALGISPLFWSQAVITEVYSLHAALTALCLLLAAWPGSSARLQRLRGLATGLAVGNHLTAIFLIPPALLAGAWLPGRKPDWRSLARTGAWLAAGLLIYLVLPLRALAKTVINWGDPLTFSNFSWLVTGHLYQGNLAGLDAAQVLERSRAWASLLLQQFGLAGLALGLVGLVYFFKPTRLYFLTLYNALIFSLFAILYATFDSYIYLLPLYISCAVWIGLGVAGLLGLVGKSPGLSRLIAALLLAVWLVSLAAARWPLVDASHDARAEQFGAQVMREAPTDAILFARSDHAIFALWYFHFALRQRPDLTVIATDLLHFDWYADSLRRTYPGIRWPQGYLWEETIPPANPSRPICQVSWYDAEVFTCQPGH